MERFSRQQTLPLDTHFGRHETRPLKRDWEDWEEDECVTIIDDGDTPLIDSSSSPGSSNRENTAEHPRQSALRNTRPSPPRVSVAQQSGQKLTRLRSRRRQMAKNAKVGITLETDMSKFSQNHVAFYTRPGADHMEPRKGKFVDAAALRALEGEPSTATVGSFHWLRKKPQQPGKDKPAAPKLASAAASVDKELSPSDAPITIGLILPEGSQPVLSPNTAVLERCPRSPENIAHLESAQPGLPAPQQQKQRSVWSPDTEDGQSPFSPPVASSSFHLQPATEAPNDLTTPVPAIPSSPIRRRRTTIIVDDDDDIGTPITLFEEDGSPVLNRKSPKDKGKAWSPAAPSLRFRGWWDEITSPFAPPTPLAASPVRDEVDKIQAGSRWWDGPQQGQSPHASSAVPPSPAAPGEIPDSQASPLPNDGVANPGISSSPSLERRPASRHVSHHEKDRIPDRVLDRTPTEEFLAGEDPPPYSPPHKQRDVRYRAVFPPGHPLNALYPPTPRPMPAGSMPNSPASISSISTGIAGTMTSPGAINMTDVPLTPPPRGAAPQPGCIPLPNRPIGTFTPGDHFYQVTGAGVRQKAERKRRLHEKEDIVARRVGGLWRGRGCLPSNGCYGRPGREGRKQRRVCLCVFAGAMAMAALVVSLAVTLSHRHSGGTPPGTMWLNLTSFPPMPTGVLTVVGPDNSESVSGCVSPSTLWSCALPQDEASKAAPYGAAQPKFIFQVQFNNSSSRSWNVTEQTTWGIKARGLADRVRTFFTRTVTGQPGSDPVPSPDPPPHDEMWFLGNTTDGIQSEDKAGEPTPFYISVLGSANETVGPDILSRRTIYNSSRFPTPDLYANGTGAPAQLFPNPTQQPLRLYDRGRATEHYGFYNYYDKTIYVTSKTASDKTAGADPSGGAPESAAKYLVTWAQTRFKVEIWTRAENRSRLLSGAGGDSPRPGTFPYPTTVTLDLHGGNASSKGTVWYPIGDDGRVDVANVSDRNVILYNLAFGGAVVNPAGSADLSLGGTDGGTGGCRCGYTNFATVSGG